MDPFGYHHFHVFLRCVHLRGPFVCREGEIHSNYLIQYPSAIIETDSTSTVFLQAASSHLWCRNSGIDLPLNFSEFQWACLPGDFPMRQLGNILAKGIYANLTFFDSKFGHILSPHFAVIQGCSATKTSRNIGRWAQGGCICKSSDFQLFRVRDSIFESLWGRNCLCSGPTRNVVAS